MRIEIADLSEDNLKDAPEWDSSPYSCKYCIYWEFPEECADLSKKKEKMKKKVKWLQNVCRMFGTCGKIVYVDGTPAGYAQYAPPAFLPGATHYPSGLPDKDAVLISCLFIPQKKYRRMGLGSRLLSNIIDDLRKKRVKAVETFARKGNPNNPSGPAEFYLRNGFAIHKDDTEHPLMKLVL